MLIPIVDLLKDEVTEADLVSPTLQALKKLLEKIPEDDHERLKYEKVIHGLLSACLLNVDAMRSVDLHGVFYDCSYCCQQRTRRSRM